MNVRVISMVTTILLMFITVLSAGIFYTGYSDASEKNVLEQAKEEKIVSDQKSREYDRLDAEAEAEYEEAMAEYEEKLKERDATIGFKAPIKMPLKLTEYAETNKIMAAIDATSSMDTLKEEQAFEDRKIQRVLIFHAAFLLLIVISEIGLLMVLPRLRRVAS